MGLTAGDQVILTIAQEIGTTRGKMQGRAVRLAEDVTGITSKFEGAAGGAFQKLMQTWDAEMNKVTAELNKFEDALHLTDKQNKAEDVAQEAAFAALQAKMEQPQA